MCHDGSGRWSRSGFSNGYSEVQARLVFRTTNAKIDRLGSRISTEVAEANESTLAMEAVAACLVRSIDEAG